MNIAIKGYDPIQGIAVTVAAEDVKHGSQLTVANLNGTVKEYRS
jgi:hypothetical protein